MAEFSLAQHLVENILPDLGLGTAGVDLFFGVAPDEKPAATATVVIIDSGGIDPAKNADRTHYQPTVQIIVYGPIEDWTTAQQKIETIRTCLVEHLPVILIGTANYYAIYQQGDIISLGQDANKRPRLSANFRFRRRMVIPPLLDTFTSAGFEFIYNHTSDSGHTYLQVISANNAGVSGGQLVYTGVFGWAICDNDWNNNPNGTLQFQAVSIDLVGPVSAIFRFLDLSSQGYRLDFRPNQVKIYRNEILVDTKAYSSIIANEYIQIQLSGGTFIITIDPGGGNERTVTYTDPTPITGQYKIGLRVNDNGTICDNLTYVPA